MLEWTDRHFRYLLRQITQQTLLYTEMITTGAILQGDSKRHLHFNEQEHPVAVQLGGSDPKALAECAKICADYGYDEINLNVGCPSDRVQSGKFGACLMAEPELVAECYLAMQNVVNIPVTIKHRTGIDNCDSYEFLHHFVSVVSSAGCQDFIIHARKAFLQGLSPKENRDIPPLIYPFVYQIKQEFPHLNVSLNGGVKTIAEAKNHLQYVDSVMIGREAYHNPFILSEVDCELFNQEKSLITRRSVVESMLPYIEQSLNNGSRLQHISRHMLGLYHGQPGGRLWRRHISENAHKAGANSQVIIDALQFVQ